MADDFNLRGYMIDRNLARNILDRFDDMCEHELLESTEIAEAKEMYIEACMMAMGKKKSNVPEGF
jgi:hypothetical protein